MAPVILKMDVHCSKCARRIRKEIVAQFGGTVWASPETGIVVVAAGPQCPEGSSLLRWWIQTKMKKEVTVISDGVEEPPQGYQYQYPGMVHLGPSASAYTYTPPPPAYYPYGGGGGGGVAWAPAPNEYAATRQYMPNQAPPCFNDDNPNGCCTVQ